MDLGNCQTIRKACACQHTNSYHQLQPQNKTSILGSGCGSVGRAVVSDTRGLEFEYRHHQNFKMNIFTVNCWKDDNKRKRGREWPFKNSFQLIYGIWIKAFWKLLRKQDNNLIGNKTDFFTIYHCHKIDGNRFKAMRGVTKAELYNMIIDCMGSIKTWNGIKQQQLQNGCQRFSVFCNISILCLKEARAGIFGRSFSMWPSQRRLPMNWHLPNGEWFESGTVWPDGEIILPIFGHLLLWKYAQ